MEPISPLYPNSEKRKKVFSTKFILALQRLNDEFLCVNTAYHLPTLTKVNHKVDHINKFKKGIIHPAKYSIFFYTLWGTFQFISGGLFDWYQQ